MSNNTSIHFHYKGAQVHCESDCGAPDTKSAIEAVDQALTAAGVTTFERGPAFGGTAPAQCSDEARGMPDETDDSYEDKVAAEEEAKAKADAQAKADAKKKADADAKAKKKAEADKKAAAKKKADEDAAEKAAREEQEAEDEPTADEDNAGAEEPETDAPGITLEELRDQVMAYAKEYGNVQGKRLVQEVGGAEKISGVAEDKWLELYKAAGGEV